MGQVSVIEALAQFDRSLFTDARVDTTALILR